MAARAGEHLAAAYHRWGLLQAALAAAGLGQGGPAAAARVAGALCQAVRVLRAGRAAAAHGAAVLVHPALRAAHAAADLAE